MQGPGHALQVGPGIGLDAHEIDGGFVPYELLDQPGLAHPPPAIHHIKKEALPIKMGLKQFELPLPADEHALLTSWLNAKHLFLFAYRIAQEGGFSKNVFLQIVFLLIFADENRHSRPLCFHIKPHNALPGS